MSIYIIEDSPLKASKILEFLSSSFPQPETPVVFGSFQSGLRAIEASPPALLLLDMTLPTFDRTPNGRDGRARPLGGYEIMRKMSLKGITSTVIVITQLESFGDGSVEVSFADITAKCANEFPNIFAGSVYFDQGGRGWCDQLALLMREWVSNND